VDSEGVRAVRPEPDVFMSGELPARPVCNAVLAFHDAVSSADSWGSG